MKRAVAPIIDRVGPATQRLDDMSVERARHLLLAKDAAAVELQPRDRCR
jgi:hypothetical protein